jgi:hypothetical protein
LAAAAGGDGDGGRDGGALQVTRAPWKCTLGRFEDANVPSR